MPITMTLLISEIIKGYIGLYSLDSDLARCNQVYLDSTLALLMILLNFMIAWFIADMICASLLL